MKKVYIDVTQSYAWKGKVTGIQRVIDETSRRFMGDKRFSPVFIIWDKNTATFYEVDFKSALLAREHAARTTKATTKEPRPSYALKLKAQAKRVYHHVPLSRTMYNVYSSINREVIKYLRADQIVKIEDGSILFMPHGGVWESETYIKKILGLKRNQNVKLVTVLYDLTPVLTPQFVVEAIRLVYKNYMKQILPESDLVLAISKNTAQDAHKWLKSIGENRTANIEVFRLGDEIGDERPKPIKVPQNYLLCVGTIEARKNHMGLYYAYKLAAEQGKQLPDVLIVGRKGWMAGDIYELIKTDPATKNVLHFMHDVNDNELAWLYEHALFSVYPSFYEGWGLPIAESLLRGTPCLVSQTSSMPEIAGDLVDYFSPYAPEQIMQKIENYAANPALLKSKKSAVKKGYKATSWGETHKQITAFIEKM